MPDANRPLLGQSALVTGASSGIGRAVALAFAEAGANVAANFIGSETATDEVVAQAKAFGVNAIAVQGDVSKEEDVGAMTDATVKAFGTIDILVANAGIQSDGPLAAMTRAKWDAVIGINLTGQFLCAKAAVAEFRRRGRHDVSRALGKIICMSSVHQVIPWAGHVNYATSKGGIHMMMQTLAQELAPEGIRVNAIAPGAIETHINESAWSTEDALKKLLTLIPYGRVGMPEDIGRAAVWLASDQSDYVVGTTLFVDGGMTLYPGFADNG